MSGTGNGRSCGSWPTIDFGSERAKQFVNHLEFLKYELDYARLRFELTEADGTFTKAARGRVEYLICFVNNLEASLRDSLPVKADANGSVLAHESVRLSVLPGVMESMTHSIVQRRWKPSRGRSGNDSLIHVSLNECHPSYALFFRATEHIIEELTERLTASYYSQFSGDLEGFPATLMPLLVVSRGRGFALDSMMAAVEAKGILASQPEAYLRSLCLTSFILVPRHAPSLFRVMPVVARSEEHTSNSSHA